MDTRKTLFHLSNPFHIYRSSAGSGKTRTLAREYILLALRNPDYFKYTLAVSFANKSAQEMKDRIIRYLGDFARGESGDLGAEIRQALQISEEQLREKSKATLSRILHQYSQFSISTIDAFFQRVIRAFTRESGLLGNFRLEVENEMVMDEVIASLIDELGPLQPDMTDWVIQFSSDKLTEGENWNIATELKKFSNELFKENYMAIADDIKAVQKDLKFSDFLTRLRSEKAKFIGFMKGEATKAMAILHSNGITPEYFSGGERGTAWKFFEWYAEGEFLVPTKTVLNSAADANAWGKKSGPGKLKMTELANTQLMPLLQSMLAYYDKNLVRYKTVDIVSENFFSYGLLSHIARKLAEYKVENNVMLLSDASHFLNGVISNSDTPFIYEKVGSFYRHYLIDEFQDTSGLQWNNFKPLFQESLDQNHSSLVVGDVKQSIYRWRGSDLGLLQEAVEREIGTERTTRTILQENWRSAENLVNFNNTVFSTASRITAFATDHVLPADAFNDVVQTPVKFPGQGFVNVEFISNWWSDEAGEGEDLALNKIPQWLEELQSKGVFAGDITILVRKNNEGQRIADFLMQYKNSPNAKKDVKYEVVSNESLRLDAASCVLLLLSALRFLNNPDDAVARGELVHEAADAMRQQPPSPEENEQMFYKAGRRDLHGLVPEEFIKGRFWLVKLSLFELTETLIRMFSLEKNTKELVYLQSFQDVVLEFGGKDKNDIAAFLDWWEEIKNKRSVQVAAKSAAVNIFTIHKSKGLQFKYVIVPFCSWSMTHETSPLLWLRSQEPPFDDLGYMAVRFKSALKQSYFEDGYKEEFTRAYLDNLNLLYVAFTRAEEGMMVMAPAPKERRGNDKIAHVGELLFDAIQQSSLRDAFDPATATFSSGKIETLNIRKEAGQYIAASLQHYISIDWRKRLVIRREGQEFFQDEPSSARLQVNYGILIHTLLSRITYKDDVDDVLRSANFEGMIIDDEREPLQAKLNAMMVHPVIGAWFSKEWNVRTESPVILPGGKIARIDRVISRDHIVKGHSQKAAIVIDYKTGERKNADRKQVEQYAGILSSMGFSDVEGYLLYVDTMEVVKVLDNMNLSLF